MAPVDLGPAVERITTLITSVSDDQLRAATPCSEMTVGDLIDHVGSFSLAFAVAARKSDEMRSPPPRPSAANLGPDWRSQIPRDLAALAEAWRDPAAWQGMTGVAGLEFPGEVAGAIAIDELVTHGWDLARATGQPYDCDSELIQAALLFVAPIAESGAPREGLFGPPVAVPDDAPALDRLVGMTGRDPGWSPG